MDSIDSLSEALRELSSLFFFRLRADILILLYFMQYYRSISGAVTRPLCRPSPRAVLGQTPEELYLF